jgi:hypothetical protein
MLPGKVPVSRNGLERRDYLRNVLVGYGSQVGETWEILPMIGSGLVQFLLQLLGTIPSRGNQAWGFPAGEVPPPTGKILAASSGKHGGSARHPFARPSGT